MNRWVNKICLAGNLRERECDDTSGASSPNPSISGLLELFLFRFFTTENSNSVSCFALNFLVLISFLWFNFYPLPVSELQIPERIGERVRSVDTGEPNFFFACQSAYLYHYH